MEKWKRDFPKVEYPPNDCKFCTERHDYWAHSYYRKASLKNRDYKNNGGLKKIVINTKKNTTKIVENHYLQNLNVGFFYNLDFPIPSKRHKNEVYCTIFDSAKGYIRGYVKINVNNFEKAKPTLFLFEDEVYGNSEPQVTVIDNIEYLISFINNEDKSYIALINIQNNYYEKIEIPTRVPPGFHSIYYKKPN